MCSYIFCPKTTPITPLDATPDCIDPAGPTMDGLAYHPYPPAAPSSHSWARHGSEMATVTITIQNADRMRARMRRSADGCNLLNLMVPLAGILRGFFPRMYPQNIARTFRPGVDCNTAVRIRSRWVSWTPRSEVSFGTSMPKRRYPSQADRE